MKILMLVNWKVKYCDAKPDDRQPPDYKIEGEDYWFYRYFKKKPEVDVIDITSFPLLENFEKNKLHFYIWQAIKAIPKLNQYDLVVSHGMPSCNLSMEKVFQNQGETYRIRYWVICECIRIRVFFEANAICQQIIGWLDLPYEKSKNIL